MMVDCAGCLDGMLSGQIENGMHGNGSNVREPHLFQNTENALQKRTQFVDGSCGQFHTVLMTKSGGIWVFGRGHKSPRWLDAATTHSIE